MVRLLISNENSISNADVTIIGFPDDSKSDSKRSGASKGPDTLRRVYNDSQYFESVAGKIPILPMSGNLNKKIFDIGNVSRDKIYNLVFQISSLGKIPIILGGDHSVTTIALKALKDSLQSKISLLYFDAHPDFVSSIRDFHGSVLTDSADCINFQKSMLIGTRASEPEEFENVNAYGLEHLTPLKIMEEGLSLVSNRIISKCSSESYAYLSVDLDCIDPVYAPAVSVPTPGGLMPLELLFLIKKACSTLHIVGLDIVELCPDYDINLNTCSIGAQLLMESIASLNLNSNHF